MESYQIPHNRDNDYNIEHILKDKLECDGQLPDILDVVEEADQIFDFNNTMKQMTRTMKVTMKTTPRSKPKRIPILPTHKWEDGGY